MKKLFVLIFIASLFSCSSNNIPSYSEQEIKEIQYESVYQTELVMDLTNFNF